jgi:hypothetical protein
VATLTSRAGGDPIAIWKHLTETLAQLTPTLSAAYPDFEFTPSELLFASDGSFSSDLLEKIVENGIKIELLQKSLLIRRGETVGIIIVLDWDYKYPTKISMSISQSIPRDIWLGEQTSKIYGFSILAAVIIAAIYLRAKLDESGPWIMHRTMFGGMAFAIGTLPGAFVGLMISTVMKAYWLPSRFVRETDQMADAVKNLIIDLTCDAAGKPEWSDPAVGKRSEKKRVR